MSFAIMSRATAGIIKGRILFSTPGSENAVRLAMEKLILPELGHLVKELKVKQACLHLLALLHFVFISHQIGICFQINNRITKVFAIVRVHIFP